MTTTLIIPAYNEEERLPRFLQDLADYLHAHPDLIQEILVVDDGSRDNTRSVAESFRTTLPILRVLAQPQNKGKGAAVQLGINSVQSDTVVFMDADGATAPEELPKLLGPLHVAPVVVGNRWMPGADTSGRTPIRAFSSQIIRLYMGTFGLADVDTMCGFKGFHRDVAVKLFNPLLNERWLFDQEVMFRARLLHIPITNVAIRWVSQHGSKVRFSTLLKASYEIPLLLLRVKKQLRATA